MNTFYILWPDCTCVWAETLWHTNIVVSIYERSSSPMTLKQKLSVQIWLINWVNACGFHAEFTGGRTTMYRISVIFPYGLACGCRHQKEQKMANFGGCSCKNSHVENRWLKYYWLIKKRLEVSRQCSSHFSRLAAAWKWWKMKALKAKERGWECAPVKLMWRIRRN